MICCVCLSLCFTLLQIVHAQTYRIYIDPGHYQSNGAPGKKEKEKVKEEEITLAVGLKLRELLQKDTHTGVRWVIRMSRETEVSRTETLNDPKERAKDADSFDANLFLSIHCNAGGGDGTETFWADNQHTELDGEGMPIDFEPKEQGINDSSKRFAQLVQEHMAHHGKWNSRRHILDRLYMDVERGIPHFEVRFRGFGGHIPILLVLKEVPGCLNEIGFLDTESNLCKLVLPYWQQRFAEAYRDAIFEYFGLTPPLYLDIPLEPGVNMISIPGIPANPDPTLLIVEEARATPIVSRSDPVNRRNQPFDTIQFGHGYQVRSSYHGFVTVSYFPQYTYMLTLEKGFHMIGSVSGTASFANTMRSANKDSDKLAEKLWILDAEKQAFEEAPSFDIKEGVGYMVQAEKPVTITVSSVFTIAAPPVQQTQETQLLANFPNPFNPETWIPFKLQQPGSVTVSIHTASGHLVRELSLGHLKAGSYLTKDAAAYWNGTDEQGDRVASGVYFYTLQTDTFSDTRKMVLLK